jgi:hypothetical protein
MAKRGIITHRKTRRLAIALGIDQTYAVGILESLWQVTAEQAPRGDIGSLTNQDIADEMFCSIEADQLIGALVRSGWLDEDDQYRLVVHGHAEHCDDMSHHRVAKIGDGTFVCGTRSKRAKNSPNTPEPAEPSENPQEDTRTFKNFPESPSKLTKVQEFSGLPEPEPEPVVNTLCLFPGASAEDRNTVLEILIGALPASHRTPEVETAIRRFGAMRAENAVRDAVGWRPWGITSAETLGVQWGKHPIAALLAALETATASQWKNLRFDPEPVPHGRSRASPTAHESAEQRAKRRLEQVGIRQ